MVHCMDDLQPAIIGGVISAAATGERPETSSSGTFAAAVAAAVSNDTFTMACYSFKQLLDEAFSKIMVRTGRLPFLLAHACRHVN